MTTRTALHPTPPLRDVLPEQLRASALALRFPAVAALLAVALGTLMLGTEIFVRGHVVDFRPERWLLPALVGVLFPIGIWTGETRFGAGFLWSLPVDRSRHALAKVFAGWVWLMAVVAIFVLWLLGLALLSGGSILAPETIRLIQASTVPELGAIYSGPVQTVRWTPRPLFWLAPFTGATALYLLGSAMALGVRHPLRWVIGAVVGFFLFATASDVVGRTADAEWLTFAPARVLDSLLHARYGLEALVVARTDFLKSVVTLPDGNAILAWRALPDLRDWAVATLIWTGAGLLALWAAVRRHRERRRP